MLSQLTQLSIAADGRYATAAELQFLKNYLSSFERRLSAYEKIRSAAEKITGEVAAKAQTVDTNLYRKRDRDFLDICKRDTKYMLRHLALTLLIDDIDHLRDSLLFWLQTIVRAFNNERPAEITHQALQDVIKQYLSPQETELFSPIVDLSRTLLSK